MVFQPRVSACQTYPTAISRLRMEAGTAVGNLQAQCLIVALGFDSDSTSTGIV